MQAPNWFLIFFIYIAFVRSSSSAASLENVEGDISSKPVSELPSRGAILEAFLNYLFTIYPSSDSTRWGYPLAEVNEFTEGTPKRLYYAPRIGKRNAQEYDDEEDEELTQEESKAEIGGTRWKRSAVDTRAEEVTEDLTGNSWGWANVRRSPFLPRLGKRSEDDILDDSEYEDERTKDNDFVSDNEAMDDFADEFLTQDYSEGDAAPRLMIKKNMAFSPRLGKRTAFIPRLGKRDFSFSPRLGKRGDFAFSPRLGKKALYTPFDQGEVKRGGFPFVPRPGKKADFKFYPRLGKRGDFAFSPRLGKKADFAFRPRLGKRGRSFIPRLGKRDASSPSSTSTNTAETWRPQESNDLNTSNNLN